MTEKKQNTPFLPHREILVLVLCYVTFPCTAGIIPVLALHPVTFGGGKPGGLPISHLFTGYSQARHTDVILPGQK